MKEIEKPISSELISGAELNFYEFKDIVLIKNDLRKIHLISSNFEECRFFEIQFRTASFFSTKLINVCFYNCDLSSTDICSIWAKGCVFKETNLDNANITDSTFEDCVFDNSIFTSVSLMNCKFINCTFEKMPIEDSTFTLNSYINCKIKNTVLTESFYYQIFTDCEFYNVNMDPQLLGFNFGFSKQVIAELADNKDLNEIEAQFINKGLYVNAAILKVNQVQEGYDLAILACISALSQMLRNNILIKADEIVYLKNLIQQLENENKISPICIIRIWQLLNDIINASSQNIAIQKSISYIRDFLNVLHFKIQEFVEKMQMCTNDSFAIANKSKTAELKIIYNQKPSIEIINCLVDITTFLNPDYPKPIFLKSQKGSYIEYHEIAIALIPYIQTIFSLLGVVVPVIIYKKEKKDRKAENEVKMQTEKQKTPNPLCTSIKLEITTTTEQSSALPNSTPITTQTNQLVTDSIKILNQQEFTTQTDFAGYNSRNIQKVTITIQ